MRGNKILVCFAFLLVFAAGVYAQEKTEQNKVRIEKLLILENITPLRFLLSNKYENSPKATCL